MKRTLLIAVLLTALFSTPHAFAQRTHDEVQVITTEVREVSQQVSHAARETGYAVRNSSTKLTRRMLDLKFGRDDDDRRRRRYRGHKLGTDRHFNIDLGINNWLENGSFPNENDEPYSVKSWGSWYVGLNHVYNTHITGKLFLDWGGGISWYNFKFEDESVRLTELPSGVNFAPTTDNTIDPIKSKLTVTYLNLSFIPMLDFSYSTKKVGNDDDEDGGSRKFVRKTHDGFRIGVGPFVGYRIGSYTKFVFEDDDNDRDRDREHDNFFIENLRYGLRAQIGFDDVDLFFQYDMNKLFSDNRGPELNAFSFGFIL